MRHGHRKKEKKKKKKKKKEEEEEATKRTDSLSGDFVIHFFLSLSLHCYKLPAISLRITWPPSRNEPSLDERESEC